MPAPDITSASNPRIRRLIALRDREARDRDRMFLVEGARDLDRAIEAGLEPTEIYWDPEHFDRPPAWAEMAAAAAVAGPALDRASYRRRSQGVIAVFPQFEVSLDHLAVGGDSLLLVAEAIEKPGNLGALLRTADAVGAAALIAANPDLDPFGPNVVRASTGALFSVPLAVATLEQALSWLERHVIRIVAADPDSQSNLWAADLAGNCALLVGSEHAGLSATARAAAHQTIAIPMLGATDSLNVSVSMAVLAYEALRQRAQAPRPQV